MIWIGIVGQVVGIIGLVTALLDMGMNGSRYAGWAPFGLGLAGIGFIAAWFVG